MSISNLPQSKAKFKHTNWIELDWQSAEILEQYPGGFRIKHPKLQRPRYFNLSQAGNYFSRYTGKESNVYALGYIFKGGPQ